MKLASPSRLLVADDDPVSLATSARALSADGHLVRTFNNGQDALKMLFAERFDLVVANERMPRLDGLALLERIRNAPFLRAMPFIITSDDAGVEVKRRVFGAGADDLIMKPVDGEHLKLKVRSIIARAQRMDVLAEASMIGRFSPKTFSDIIQLMQATRKTGLMRIIRGPSLTQLWFRNGEIRFARDEAVEGQQAVYNLVKASNGRFEFVEGESLDVRNISKPQMFILLEFSRKLDTYYASRKVTLGREFQGESERLDNLIVADAKKYMPDTVENCRVLIEQGRQLLADDDVEGAELTNTKLHETLEWAYQELQRLKSDTMKPRRSMRREAVSPFPEVAVEESPKPSEIVAESTATPDVQAPDVKTIDLDDTSSGLQTDTWAAFVSELQEKFRVEEEEPPLLLVPDEELPVSAVDEISFEPAPSEPASGEDGDLEEAGTDGSAPVLITGSDSIPADDEPQLTISVSASNRLIQRFPPDVVEMMQVELGKSSIPLIVNGQGRKLVDAVKYCNTVHSFKLGQVTRVLSDAWFSKASVLCVVVLGTSEDLKFFFSTLARNDAPTLDSGRAYLSRIVADIDLTMYIIGLDLLEMDSFDGENLMDRGNSGILIVPAEEDFRELFVDALSLSMVKFQRSRVFVTGRDEVLSRAIRSACESYSLPPANRVPEFDTSTEAVENIVERVISAFSPSAPL